MMKFLQPTQRLSFLTVHLPQAITPRSGGPGASFPTREVLSWVLLPSGEFEQCPFAGVGGGRVDNLIIIFGCLQLREPPVQAGIKDVHYHA